MAWNGHFLADEDPVSIVVACVALLVIVVAAAYAVMWLRKRMWGTEEESAAGAGFTLGDLRHLHKTGQISEDEFAKAKEKVLEAARRAAEREAARNDPNKPAR